MKVAEEVSADYIIVGAGIAGCTLAARLQKKLPSASIVLIEAGPDPSDDLDVQSASGSRAARAGNMAWHINVLPNANLGGRSHTIDIGKAMGGGGAINGGAWTRGPASDYNLWAEVVRDSSWNYESMLPYFRLTETHHGRIRDEVQHGYDGPIHVTPIYANHPKRLYPLREPLKKAWEEGGVKYIPDGNNGYPLGVADIEEAWLEGKRQLPSKSFDLSRVKILPETLVERVTTQMRNGKLTATGVDLIGGHHISATKEVVVSSGVCHTPKVLMLSGIGDRAALERHSIPVNLDNPEVGKNLMDHLSVGLTWKLKHPERGLAMGSPLLVDPSFANGWPMDFIQFGHVSTEGIKAVLQSSPTKVEDEKLLLRPDACHTETVCLYAPMPHHMTGTNLKVEGEHITTVTICLNPTSRGYVTIASSDPTDPPIIDVNFNATEVDRYILREGLRKTVSVMRDTKSGQSFVEDEDIPEGHNRLLPDSSDEAFNNRIRDFGLSLYHLCGSCAMGKVVDSKCKVIGVEGLRVVDASIFPIPISAHPQVCVYALAEKAADIMAEAVTEQKS